MNPDLGATFGSKFRGIIKSVEAPDDYTIVLNLSKPYAPLLTMLGFRFGNEIVPFHTLSNIPLKDWRTSDANLKPGVLPSLGPYKPIEKVEGQYTLYAKNDLWFGWGQDDTQQVNNAPKYVRHVVIPEAATALAALEKGDVHFLEHFYKLDAEYPRLSKETAVHVLTTPTYYLEDLHINLNNPVLSNKWVRKAISYAIPRETYVKQVINGLGIPISLPIPLSSWAYNPSVKSPHPYDIAQARQFMTTAGYNYDWLAPPEIPYSAYVIGLVLGVAAGAIVSALIIKTRHKKA
jgi:ABC-type transport system substrate-binding protein